MAGSASATIPAEAGTTRRAMRSSAHTRRSPASTFALGVREARSRAIACITMASSSGSVPPVGGGTSAGLSAWMVSRSLSR